MIMTILYWGIVAVVFIWVLGVVINFANKNNPNGPSNEKGA